MAKASTQRPPHLPHGRWLGDFEPLNPVERSLVECCANGKECQLADERPESATDANRIRAGLVRFLALGGDAANPVHEQGIYLTGAWIVDKFDIDGAKLACSLLLHKCHFEERIVAPDAELPGLSLGGSKISGLQASRLIVTSGVYLNDGFVATGSVYLDGAQIGSELYCGKGSFALGEGADPSDYALIVDCARVGGNLYFGDGFKASGGVSLIGAQVRGDLDCSSGIFEVASGNDAAMLRALNADRAEIDGSMFLRSGLFSGVVDLTGAKIGSLVDGYSPSPASDDSCWPSGQLMIDGFRYDRIGAGPSNASRRIAWLRKQVPVQLGADFRPQPWEQLIKVLREMGHPDEARKVAIAKQDAITDNTAGKWRWFWRKGFKIVASYGYEPWRLVGWAMCVWLGFAVLYLVYDVGHLPCDADRWCAGNQLRPLAYSLDVILPIDFGLADKGVPGEAINLLKQPTGTAVRVLTGIETTLGWVLAGVLAAIAGGLVKKD